MTRPITDQDDTPLISGSLHQRGTLPPSCLPPEQVRPFDRRVWRRERVPTEQSWARCWIPVVIAALLLSLLSICVGGCA